MIGKKEMIGEQLLERKKRKLSMDSRGRKLLREDWRLRR